MDMLAFTRSLAVVWLVAVPATALAQDDTSSGASRDYCPARPGIGTPACTIEPGKVSVEVGIAGWTRDKQDGVRTDSYDFGDTSVRFGVSDNLELIAGWQLYSESKSRSVTGNMTASGIGDAMLGAKLNFSNPDGSGFSAAVQPFVTLPIGDNAVSAGDWGAGLVLPFSYDLSNGVSLQYTHEFDAAVNESGKGRHFATSGTIGLGHNLSDNVGATAELQLAHDDDPLGVSTQLLGGLSVGWTPSDRTQFDLGANIGLNKAAPDIALYGGISRRF